jgi:uncharacterized ubiquitin-like protein YukD
LGYLAFAFTENLAFLDLLRYNVAAFDLAVPLQQAIPHLRDLPAEVQQNSARFQHKGNKATPWKQEQ